MNKKQVAIVDPKLVESGSFWIRKLTKSGGTKYLSITTILPSTWQAVKIKAIVESDEVYVLRIEPIK